MFDNVFAILFGIIDIAEPAVELEDTALFVPIEDEPPQMRTQRIELNGLHDLSQLHGCLVAYRMDTGSAWITGHITATEESKFGRVSVYFVPDTHPGMSLLPKWRDLSDFMYCVWD